MSRNRDAEPLIDKLERLEGRARRDFLDGDYGRSRAGQGSLPGPTRRSIRSSARLVAFDVLNDATAVAGRNLFALIDAAASLLIHGGGAESARLCLEVVTTPDIAGDVVRVLADG
jgi:hypothetical protein